MDRLTSMAVFAKVAETRSFSGAARSLRLSQATVSKHVQALEGWLGAKLLNRTTRRVELTELGRRFHPQCERLLRELESMRSAGPPTGPLQGIARIACATSLGGVFLERRLAALTRQHAGLSIEIVLHDEPAALVRAGFDLGLVLGPTPDASVGCLAIANLEQVLCAAPGYIADRGMPHRPEDLANHLCLGLGDEAKVTWTLRGRTGVATCVPSIRLRSNSLAVLRCAARAGAGILLAPHFAVAEDIETGGLVRVLAAHQVPAATMSALYAERSPLPDKISRLLAVMSEAWPTPDEPRIALPSAFDRALVTGAASHTAPV